MNATLTWIEGDPPRRTGPLFAKLVKLRERPGRWAELSTYATPKSASNMKYALTSGKLSVPDGTYEFAVHGATVLARFVAPEIVDGRRDV